MNKINFFWLQDSLTELGVKSIQSFQNNGYECVLWTYGEVDNSPCIVKDAAEIIPLTETADIRKFCDWFRINLIYQKGGWWSDCDNICIQQLPSDEYVFAGAFRSINTNIFKCPKGAEILKDIIDSSQDWEEQEILYLNVKRIKEFIVKHNLTKQIAPKDWFNCSDSNESSVVKVKRIVLHKLIKLEIEEEIEE